MTRATSKLPMIRDMHKALTDYEVVYGHTAVGDQIRTDHVTCGDAKRRFYIKRVVREDGKPGVVGYCHNCGYGVHSYSIAPVYAVSHKTLVSTEPGHKIVMPPDFKPTLVAAAHEWLVTRHHFTTEQLADHGVGWSEQYQRIVLPVRDGIVTRGCQLRRVGIHGPKYISMRGDAPLEGWLSHPTTYLPRRIAVITEDLLSAWRCFDAGYDALPLLGYHVRPERLAKLIEEGTPNWVVWLDNDKPEIVDASRYIQSLLRAMGGTVHGMLGSIEAKELTVEQVKSKISVESQW